MGWISSVEEKRNQTCNPVKKVAVTGPESTGKSWLTGKLGQYYRAVTVAEYAREYLENIQRPYTLEDVVAIGLGQNRRIGEAFTSEADMVVSDTELLVISIWINFKYHISDAGIEKLLAHQQFDHYLLCNTDLPWEEDPLRENPFERQQLFSLYQQKLEDLGFPYTVISGVGDDRLLNAVRVLDRL